MKKSRRYLSLLLTAALAGGALAACGGSGSTASTTAAASQAATEAAAPAAAGETQAAAESAGAGKTDIIIAMPEDLETFDPAGSSAMVTMATTKMMYTRLYDTHDDSQPVPLLAQEMIEVSDNEVDFKIPEGVKFSDGSDLNAEDVVASLERARQSPTFSTLMKGIISFEKGEDDYTIKCNTDGPVPYIRLALSHAGTGIIPKEYAEAGESADWDHPVCSGPYILSSRTLGSETVIEKNPDYWDNGGETEAKNEKLTFKVVPEASSRTIQVQTGEADVSFNFSTADYNTVSSDPNVTLYQKTGTVTQYLCMNTRLAPFDNEKVRLAVCYAIDREAIMTIVADGFGTVTGSTIPPTTNGWVDNPAGYTYDPEKAKELLKEAGYPDGFETKILAFNDLGKRVCEASQQYLADVGIKASIETYDSSVRLDMSANDQIPFMAAQWGAMSDCALVLPRLFTEAAIGGMNFSKYTNPELDELFAKAQNTYDEKVREEAYQECVKILADKAPWCPIYIPDSFVLARADLQGVHQDGESIILLNQLHY